MDKDDTKAVIRSLLTSTTRAYNVRQLLRDFKEQEGIDLPCYGYRSSIDFLHSIPDTCRLLGSDLYAEVCLVASDKSAHVTSLVERQRATTSRRRPAYPPQHRRVLVPIRKVPSPVAPRFERSRNSVNESSNWNSGPPPASKPASVPEPAKPRPVLGSNSSWSNGYDRSPAVAQKANHVDYGRTHAILATNDSWSNADVKPPTVQTSNHVANERKYSESATSPKQTLKSENSALSVSSLASNSYSGSKYGDSLENGENGVLHEEFEDYSSHISNEEQKIQNSIKPKLPRNCIKEKTLIGDIKENEVRTASRCGSGSSGSSINSRLRDRLKRLISNYPDGLWCCDLPEVFEKEFNYLLDFREYGYTSFIQMASELPDVFRCVRPDNTDWLLFDASKPETEKELNMAKTPVINIPNYIKSNLLKLISSHCESTEDIGLSLNDVLPWYFKMFGRRLQYDELGFKDIKSFLDTLEGDIVHLRSINGRIMVMPILKKMERLVDTASALPPITPDSDIFSELFPKDVLRCDERVPPLDLSVYLEQGDQVDITVAEVWNPHKFYMQLKKFNDDLTKVMNDMQLFYKNSLNRYKMPESTLLPNQYCVGIHQPAKDAPIEWHRARIVKLLDKDRVSVKLIDYGTETKIKRDSLRFLTRKFGSLPEQAFLGQLPNIKPVDDDVKWKRESCIRFLDLVSADVLVAHVIEVDYEECRVSVSLTDRTNEKIVDISKTLVDEKMAVYKVKSRTGTPASKPSKLNSVATENIFDVNNCYKNPVADVYANLSDPLKNVAMVAPQVNPVIPKSPAQRQPYSSLDPRLGLNVATPTNAPLGQFPISPTFDYGPQINNTKVPIPQPQSPALGGLPTASQIPNMPAQKEVKPPPGFSSPAHPMFPVPAVSDLKILQMQCQLEALKLEKRRQEEKIGINTLALKLLANHPELIKIGQMNPSAALEIATNLASIHYEKLKESEQPPSNPQPDSWLNKQQEINSAWSELKNIYDVSSLLGRQFALNLNQLQAPQGQNSQPVMEQPKTRQERVVPIPGMISPNAYPRSFEDVNVIEMKSRNRKLSSFILEVEVAGDRIHIINIESRPYVIVNEIVKLFAALPRRETADFILQTKNINYAYKKLRKQENLAFFQELSRFTIAGIPLDVEELDLLPLNCTVQYLQTLACTDRKTLSAFHQLMEQINPKADGWTSLSVMKED